MISVDDENLTELPVLSLQCDLPWWFPSLTKKAAYAEYTVIAPIYAVLSMGGFLFILVVVAKQTRDDRAYFYQLLLAITQTLEALTLAVCIFAFDWAGVDTEGRLWFQQSYVLMWYQSHLAIPFNQLPITTSLYLAISMSIDRLFALSRPIEYKSIDRRRHQYVALVLSVSIGVASSVHNGFLFNVGPGDGRYWPVFNVDFAGSRIGAAMTGAANFVRIFGLLLLIGCNVMLIRLFRKRSSKVAALAVDSRDLRSRDRRKKERTLIVLTLCEATFCAVKQFSECIFYSMAYMADWPCYDDLAVPILDLFLQLASLADVLAPFLVSKQMRATARSFLPRRRRRPQPIFPTTRTNHSTPSSPIN